MRLLAVLAMISGSGLIGVSAGGIVSSGADLRAADSHKCPLPHVRQVKDL